MCTSVNLSLFLFLNIDTSDEWCRPRDTLESAFSPDPGHVAFAFASLASTSDLDVREILAFMGSQHAEDCLSFLYSLVNIEDRLTIHFCFMDLRRLRAIGKMLHEDKPGKSTAKDSVPISQIIDHAFSLPAHGRMARFDGVCLGITDETDAHDEQDDCWCDQLSELHDDSLHSTASLLPSVRERIARRCANVYPSDHSRCIADCLCLCNTFL